MQQKADKIREKQANHSEDNERMQGETQATATRKTTLQQEIGDLMEARRGLAEAETKEMKGITKKSLSAIKSYYNKNDNDKVVCFALDSMTKFIRGDSKVTYGLGGAVLFANVDELQQNIRKTDHSKMETAEIQEIMRLIVGDDKQE